MTLVCVPISVASAEQAEADLRAAAGAGADLAELRLDAFLDADDASEREFRLASVERLIESSPLALLITIRPAREGGAYDGDERARLAMLRRLGNADPAPAYVDIEADVSDPPETVARQVRSWHDFRGPPADLSRRMLALLSQDPGAIKIAFRARTVRDITLIADILEQRDRPTIALAMGEAGLASRVLAPKLGGLLTFASLREESATAPGQPTIGELLGRYRLRDIGPNTRVFGVIGWPVAHSRSPAVHNALFTEHGIDAVYLPLPVEPSAEALKATVLTLMQDDRIGLAGASVTLPHKAALLELAQEQGWAVEPLAARVGAANTLHVGADGPAVSNTDAPAITAAIAESGRLGPGGVAGTVALVLGAGGVARAAAVALAEAGCRVRVRNRTRSRAEALAADLTAMGLDIGVDDGHGPFRVVVNATSVGMRGGPEPDATPIDICELPTDAVVLDTVYTPNQTPLIRAARAAGLSVVTGDAVFRLQALAQFAVWTGLEGSPVTVDRAMRSAATD